LVQFLNNLRNSGQISRSVSHLLLHFHEYDCWFYSREIERSLMVYIDVTDADDVLSVVITSAVTQLTVLLARGERHRLFG
jgi:hypothetical protein